MGRRIGLGTAVPSPACGVVVAAGEVGVGGDAEGELPIVLFWAAQLLLRCVIVLTVPCNCQEPSRLGTGLACGGVLPWFWGATVAGILKYDGRIGGVSVPLLAVGEATTRGEWETQGQKKSESETSACMLRAASEEHVYEKILFSVVSRHRSRHLHIQSFAVCVGLGGSGSRGLRTRLGDFRRGMCRSTPILA